MATDVETQDRRKRVYDLHSWSGICLGLIVFVVVFSGCIALFRAELQTWADPARRLDLAANPAPIHDVFDDWIVGVSEGKEVTFSSLSFPSASDPYYAGFVNVRDEEGKIVSHQQRWDTQTAAEFEARQAGAVRWLYDFHRELGWPKVLGGRQIGRGLVGIVGVILMLSILTGIITHRKMMKEFFTMRYTRSVRLKWQDTHKVLGLWSLPFSVMISFTGAFLGVVALLLPVMTLIVVQGDTEQLVKKLGLGPQDKAGVAVEMLSLDEVRTKRHSNTDLPASSVSITNWGDQSAVYEVLYKSDDKLIYYQQKRISGVTGEPLPATPLQEQNAANRTVGAVAPLHYATFGGIALKFLYVVLAIILSVITAFGNLMWLERRLYGNEGNRSEAFYRRLGRFTVGTVMGLPVATAGVLAYDLMYTGAEAARYNSVIAAFFIIWFAILALAMVIRNQYWATRGFMALTGAIFALLPVINGILYGEFFWQAISTKHSNAGWADVSFLITGLLTLGVSALMPTRRVETQRKPRAAKDYRPSLVPGE